MPASKTLTSRWARLAVDYYRNTKLLTVGPIAELAYVRLICLARETMETTTRDGAINILLASREIRDVVDIWNSVHGTGTNELLNALCDAGLVRIDGDELIIEDYDTWQTTKEELRAVRKGGKR